MGVLPHEQHDDQKECDRECGAGAPGRGASPSTRGARRSGRGGPRAANGAPNARRVAHMPASDAGSIADFPVSMYATYSPSPTQSWGK